LRQQRKANRFSGALFNGLVSATSIEISRREARVRRAATFSWTTWSRRRLGTAHWRQTWRRISCALRVHWQRSEAVVVPVCKCPGAVKRTRSCPRVV